MKYFDSGKRVFYRKTFVGELSTHLEVAAYGFGIVISFILDKCWKCEHFAVHPITVNVAFLYMSL